MKTNAQTPQSTSEINNFHPSTANWLLAFLGVLGLILASLALSSCSAYTAHAAGGAHEADSVATGTGVLTPSSTAVDFGNVGVGSPSTQTVSVTNTGTATVSISQPTVSGVAFTLAAGTSITSLAAGQATSVQIEYDPTSMGSSTGTLTFVSSATNSPVAIALSGTGTEREIAASPTALNFSSVSVGQNGAQSVTLTNSGNATITINQVSTTGAGYSTSGISAGQTIAANASMAFTATFTPSAAGAVPGSVTITTNAVNSTISIPLSGTGAQGSIAATPGSVSFGNVVVGSNNSQQVTIKNSGNATVTINQVSTTGTGYTTSGISAGQTIAANASLAFTTTFAPSGAGAVPGSVTITTNAANPTTSIPLNGTGTQGSLAANPGSISFGNVVMGNSNSQQITIQNTGTATVTFTAVNVTGTGMSVTGISSQSTLAAGASVVVNAIFTPSSTAAVTGGLTLVASGSTPGLTIGLSGTGSTATFLLGISPSTLNFNTVTVGNSSSLTSKLTNNGNSNIDISGVTVGGAGFNASGVSNGTILMPGQSATLTVTFAPASAGIVSGAGVSIASNATGSPSAITLSGTGQAPTSHSVSLSWGPSSSETVTGYNVFRATTSGGYGSTPLNPSPLPSTAFTDTSVAAGQTYYYVTTALDSSVSSTDSNEVSVNVP